VFSGIPCPPPTLIPTSRHMTRCPSDSPSSQAHRILLGVDTKHTHRHFTPNGYIYSIKLSTVCWTRRGEQQNGLSRGFRVPDGRDIDARWGKTSTKDRIATRNADQCDHQCNKSIQWNDHSNVDSLHKNDYDSTISLNIYIYIYIYITAATVYFVSKHRDDYYNEVKLLLFFF